jgi:hypothetical protein
MPTRTRGSGIVTSPPGLWRTVLHVGGRWNEGFRWGCCGPVGKDEAYGMGGWTVAVMGDWPKSRVREICKHGSVRGGDGLGQGRIL